MDSQKKRIYRIDEGVVKSEAHKKLKEITLVEHVSFVLSCELGEMHAVMRKIEIIR